MEITTADALQLLISAGHSWTELKGYTLDQIALWCESIIKMNNIRRIDTLLDMHVASQGSSDNINQHIGTLRPQKELGPAELIKAMKKRR